MKRKKIKIWFAFFAGILLLHFLVFPYRYYAMTMGGFEIEVGEGNEWEFGEDIGADFSDETITETPQEEILITNTPVIEVQISEVPKVEPSKIEAPKIEAPKIEAPKIKAPEIEVPETEAPVIGKSIKEVTIKPGITMSQIMPTITNAPSITIVISSIDTPIISPTISPAMNQIHLDYRIEYKKLKLNRKGKIYVEAKGAVRMISVRMNGKDCIWHWEGKELILEKIEEESEYEIEILYFVSEKENTVNFYVDE